MSDRQKKILIVLILLLIVALPARITILSRATKVSLTTDPIAYQIEKALQVSGSNYRPLEGKDYTVGAEKYFDSDEWVALTVKPISNSLNPESLVLKKTNGSYSVVYGPSNFFQEASFNSLPTNIKNYLIGK